MTPDDDRKALVEYWFDKAAHAIESATREVNDGDVHFSVNRCYYACFYAFSAVLAHNNRSLKKHTGVRAMLHKDFVRQGLVPKEFGRLYDRLFLDRQRGDYSPLTEFDPSLVRGWIDEVKKFVDWCKRHVLDTTIS